MPVHGSAIGSGVARELGVGVGDEVKLISPDGVKTAFGVSPRVKSYEIAYIFTAGRYDIDRTRVYMPFAEAQLYFNRDGVADELEADLAKSAELAGRAKTESGDLADLRGGWNKMGAFVLEDPEWDWFPFWLEGSDTWDIPGLAQVISGQCR